MALSIPGELAFVLELLGFEWPMLDEDELHRGAQLVRNFQEDLDSSIDIADQRIQQAFANETSKTSQSYLAAWDENRSTNMRELSDLLGPVSIGVDLFADAVLALKLKVIAELVITAAQIAAAIASAVVTFGAGAALQLVIIAARKKALDILTDLLVDQAIGIILEKVSGPLMDAAQPLLMKILDSPLAQAVGGEVEAVVVDYQALESASTELGAHAEAQESMAADYAAQFMSLQISQA